MSALFEFPLASELLEQEEIEKLTGAKHSSAKIEWLERNQWDYVLKKSGEPVVGRMYARLKLAGINPSNFTPQDVWTPDFSALKK